MKFLLVAVYLAKGAAVPAMETRAMPSKAACQTLARQWVERLTVGQGRAFCLPLKG